MKKIILLFTIFLLSYSINAQNISISGSTSGTKNSTIEYTCDISYRLHKYATYSERPQGIRFGIKNFKIVDVSYNSINASEIDNISLPKSCGKVIGVLSGDYTISQGNKTLSGTFYQSSIGSGTDFTDNFDFSTSTKNSIINTFGKDIDAKNLNLKISNVKYSDNGSASNCTSSIVNDIYSFSDKKEQIIKLKDKISIYGSTKEDLLKKQSLFKQLASIDKTNNYQNELEELEEEMRTLAKKELKNEEKSTEPLASAGLTVETKKDGSKDKNPEREKDDYEKIKKEEQKKKTENEKAAELRFQLTQQYNSMVTQAKNLQSNGKKNTQAYKNLLKQIRGHEGALNIPRHETFDNPGFVNENTGNTTFDDTYKKVNDVKESSAKIGDAVGGALSNLFMGMSKKEDAKWAEDQKQQDIEDAIAEKNYNAFKKNESKALNKSIDKLNEANSKLTKPFINKILDSVNSIFTGKRVNVYKKEMDSLTLETIRYNKESKAYKDRLSMLIVYSQLISKLERDTFEKLYKKNLERIEQNPNTYNTELFHSRISVKIENQTYITSFIYNKEGSIIKVLNIVPFISEKYSDTDGYEYSKDYGSATYNPEGVFYKSGYASYSLDTDLDGQKMSRSIQIFNTDGDNINYRVLKNGYGVKNKFNSSTYIVDNNGLGIIDISKGLKPIVPFHYSSMKVIHYKTGIIKVKKANNSNYGLIDLNNTLLVPYSYKTIDGLGKNLYKFSNSKKGRNWVYGVINLKNEIVIPAKYYRVDISDKEIIRVQKKYGKSFIYFNSNGEKLSNSEVKKYKSDYYHYE